MACLHRRTVVRPAGPTCIDCGAVRTADPAAAAVAASAWPGLDRLAVIHLATALAAALLVLALDGLPRFILRYLGILVHECGHAAVAWLFARPAIPKFDLADGGGLTHWGERMTVLVLAWLAVIGYAAWTARTHRRLQVAVLAAGALWSLLLVAGWDMPLLVAGGHLAELACGCLFLVRAASGRWVAHAAERWLSGLVGWLLCLEVLALSWGLLHDSALRSQYEAGKSSVDNDLVLLAGAHWNTSLDAAAWVFLLLAVAAPALVLMAWARWGPRLAERLPGG